MLQAVKDGIQREGGDVLGKFRFQLALTTLDETALEELTGIFPLLSMNSRGLGFAAAGILGVAVS